MLIRPRRLRKTPIIREAVAETRLSKNMLIYPYFIVPGKRIKFPIPSMPGIFHFSTDELLKDAEMGLKHGINKILLFGTGDKKTEDGSSAYSEKSIVAKTLTELKKKFGDGLCVITDVCLCAYTTHGHCGVAPPSPPIRGVKNQNAVPMGSKGQSGPVIDNDASVVAIAKMALAHANAGADIVAPSDMMDGRVRAIRELLDAGGFKESAIMSYSTKFASYYYGPFREAAGSAPGFGDRKTYQMDIRNKREAIRESLLDEAEGADILMVKPALAFLDVIAALREKTLLPIACYNVSGEYAMVKAAAEKKWLDERSIVMENMYAFSRAGADLIITYHARDIVDKKWLMVDG